MRRNPHWIVIVVVGIAISLVGDVFGAWWLTFAAGLFVGGLVARARIAVPAGALAGLLGWALPLAAAQFRYGLGPAAKSLAAIMGFTQAPAVPVILTCLVGLLLGLCGAWLGAAIRSLVRTQPAISR